MSGFAGTLKERVTILTPTPTRDALGGEGADWTVRDVLWAAIVPDGRGRPQVGEARSGLPAWRVTLRACALGVGDRIEWASGMIDVAEVRRDPRSPDRIVAIGEERR